MRIEPRTAAKAAAAALVTCLALTACGSVKMGAAAVTGSDRISSATLTAQVKNLNAAYRADEAKGIAPKEPTTQEAQEVLGWLIDFRIIDQVAADNHISPTPAQVSAQVDGLASAASQNSNTLPEYLSSMAALPPDLTPQFARYYAIGQALENRLTGGKALASESTAEQNKIGAELAHDQCVASKSLRVQVNPQYGQFDYNSFGVVPGTSKLAADPTPSASAAVRLTPPC